MAREKSTHVFELVKRLTKTEKRYFKLSVSQHERKGNERKFVQLFDILDKATQYDESSILAQAPDISASQLPNLKAHLYARILQALRQYERNKLTDIEIREMIDYVELLFNRGLYEQCVDIIKKAQKKAHKFESLELQLELYRWEKNVLSMTLGKNNQNRVNNIVKGVEETNNRITNINRYTNLSVKLNSLYMKIGFVKNETDLIAVRSLFELEIPEKPNEDSLSFAEKVQLYRLYVYYYTFIQEIDKAYYYADRWVTLLEDKGIERIPILELYIQGLNNLLSTLYKLGHYTAFETAQLKLKKLNTLSPTLRNDNIRMKLSKYTIVHEFNRLFMLGHFSVGVDRLNRIKHRIDDFINRLDKHSRIIMYYKISCLYVGNSNYREAIHWLNHIINTQDVEIDMREDVHSFARILSMICHYELGNKDVMEYYIRSTYRQLLNKGNMYLMQKYILQFLRKLQNVHTNDRLEKEFISLKEKLEKLTEDPFEKRPFQYFDIISWLESKINKESVQEVIQRKAAKQLVF
ncbi:hypothetical protein [Algivirga pacifica]|uniref:Uncharacterized protein n=1 Tax=Algivirga pacifica TaxID=1162670 RepID=A0ABP9DQL8_9BACT